MSLTLDPQPTKTDIYQDAVKVATIYPAGFGGFNKPIGKFFPGSDLNSFTTTNVTLTQTAFSRGMTLSGSKVTPQVPGYYRVTGTVTGTFNASLTAFPSLTTDGTSAGIVQCGVQINTTVSGGADYAMVVDAILPFNGTTNFISLWLYSGGTVTRVYGSVGLTNLTLEWVAPL